MADKSLKERLEEIADNGKRDDTASPYVIAKLRDIAQALQEQADSIRLEMQLSPSAAIPIVALWADRLAPRKP